MASEQIISLRVSQEFFDQYAAYVSDHFGDARGARSVAAYDAINSQMNGGAVWVNQAHADQRMLIDALEAEVAKQRDLCSRLRKKYTGVSCIRDQLEYKNTELSMEVDRLQSAKTIRSDWNKHNSERIPTPKKKQTAYVLSEHTKARLEVFSTFEAREHFAKDHTSSDIAWVTGQSTNNVAKRIQELASEGYLEVTGEYRKSRDSGKMLTVWKRTTKTYYK